MLAVHLRPGPRGYAVITENIILADGLTPWRALRMVREGKDLDPKYSGNHPMPVSDGRRRVPRYVYYHNQAQSPTEFVSP